MTPAAERRVHEDEPHEDVIMNIAQVLRHRLSGLVTSIEGYTGLLTETLGCAQQREMALRIFESTNHMERLLADLQRYSQEVEPVARNLKISPFTRELLHFPDQAEARRIILCLDTEDGQTVRADPVLLRQAILILLQNALEASGDAIRLTVDRQQGHVRWVVWNDGVIEAGGAERVFDPFFTTKSHNLGVGLPLARRIARAHDGSVELIGSNARRGTRFALILPAAL